MVFALSDWLMIPKSRSMGNTISSSSRGWVYYSVAFSDREIPGLLTLYPCEKPENTIWIDPSLVLWKGEVIKYNTCYAIQAGFITIEIDLRTYSSQITFSSKPPVSFSPPSLQTLHLRIAVFLPACTLAIIRLL